MDDSSHDQMERYEALAEQEREYRAEKDSLLEAVGDDLTAAVEAAIDRAGATVEVDSTANDGTTQTLRARLDRAALVAAVSEELPAGFAVKRIHTDGTLTVEWDRRDDPSPGQRAQIILKAIVREEIATDADELVTDVPSTERVIERAVELGVDRERAQNRLTRLESFDIVDIDDEQVFPGKNFSDI